MSYDIDIKHKKTRRTVRIGDSCFNDIDITEFNDYGGTYCLSPIDDLSTNITYNYAPFFVKAFGEEGIRSIYHKPFEESVKMLEKAKEIYENADTSKKEWIYKYPRITKKQKETWKRLGLGECKNPEGYWACTVENCLKAVNHLLFLADTMKKLATSSDMSLDDFEFDGD